MGAMDAILTADGLLALATLTFLEIVLGVDNVIFISILSGKLPLEQQPRARRLGLAAAMVMRLLLLASVSRIVRSGFTTARVTTQASSAIVTRMQAR